MDTQEDTQPGLGLDLELELEARRWMCVIRSTLIEDAERLATAAPVNIGTPPDTHTTKTKSLKMGAWTVLMGQKVLD